MSNPQLYPRPAGNAATSRSRRGCWHTSILLALVCGLTVRPSLAQATFPQIEAETLAKTHVRLPQDAAGKVAILIVTFSRAAAEGGKTCSQHLRATFPSEKDVANYQVAVLSEVPRLIRGLVVRGIRAGTPSTLHPTFLTIFSDTEAAALKRETGFQKDDEPYVLVLDRGGKKVWNSYGSCSAEQLRELKQRVYPLMNASR